MRVQTELRNDEIWLKPVGALDAAGARVVRTETAALNLSGTPNVTVDLSDVPFLDSSGLGALIALAKKAARQGGRVRLFRPGEQPLRLVQLTHLDRFFEVLETA